MLLYAIILWRDELPWDWNKVAFRISQDIKSSGLVNRCWDIFLSSYKTYLSINCFLSHLISSHWILAGIRTTQGKETEPSKSREASGFVDFTFESRSFVLVTPSLSVKTASSWWVSPKTIVTRRQYSNIIPLTLSEEGRMKDEAKNRIS